MPVDLVVPGVGESITEVEIGEWLKGEGDSVNPDDPVVVLETEKATVELPAPVAGTITRILKKQGDRAKVGEVVGQMEEGKATTPAKSPAVAAAAAPVPPPAPRAEIGPAPVPPAKPATPPATSAGPRGERIVPMTSIRRRIAERLVESQRNAAVLTTFNDADMSAVIAVRKKYGEAFQLRHGVKLGFMSFFVKAAIEALKTVPEINAEIRGTDIVYRDFYDIGIAVGGGRGLVVPVLRNAERMSLADIEKSIEDFARRAKDNTIRVDELQGGTFTISNGGIYGSLMSTPIINPPQSGVLGMHRIEERAVVRDGEIVARPMMYVALSYDHRIVDGRESVLFLKTVKEIIEDPARLILDL